MFTLVELITHWITSERHLTTIQCPQRKTEPPAASQTAQAVLLQPRNFFRTGYRAFSTMGVFCFSHLRRTRVHKTTGREGKSGKRRVLFTQNITVQKRSQCSIVPNLNEVLHPKAKIKLRFGVLQL